MQTRKMWFVLGAVVVVVAGLGFAWSFLRDDAELDTGLSGLTATTASSPGAGTAAPTTPVGSWVVQPGPEVFVGYEVDEVFQVRGPVRAVGTTPAVSGELTVAEADGALTVPTATFTADLTQLSSDADKRDAYLGANALETDTFPEATFTLTEPIVLPAEALDGTEVTVTAVGDLTLRDTTRQVSIPLTAAWTGSTIAVGGGTEIVFADFGIPQPSAPGITVSDRGQLKLRLAFVPS